MSFRSWEEEYDVKRVRGRGHRTGVREWGQGVEVRVRGTGVLEGRAKRDSGSD